MQGGGARDRQFNLDDCRRRTGPFKWMNELRDDLLHCFDSNNPTLEENINRMNEMCCEIRPRCCSLT